MNPKYLCLFLLSCSKITFITLAIRTSLLLKTITSPQPKQHLHVIFQHQMCRCSRMKTFCQGVLPSHTLPSLQSPAFLHMHFPAPCKEEPRFFCVQIQTAHSTVTEEKHWATWGRKASWALEASFYAHTWTARAQAPNFTSALPLTLIQTALRQARKASSFSLLSWGKWRTWSSSTSCYNYSFLCLVQVVRLGILTSLKNKGKMALFS